MRATTVVHKVWRIGIYAVGLLAGLWLAAGCGDASKPLTWTPAMRVVSQPVSSMPSFYSAIDGGRHFWVSARAPFRLYASDGASWPMASRTRPRIVYVMPGALVLLVSEPAYGEELVNLSTRRVVGLWRLPRAISLHPVTLGAFGDHSFFWQSTVGSMGPVDAFGGYDMARRVRLRLKLAQLEGTWFDDVRHAAFYSVNRGDIAQWHHGHWVAKGHVPAQDSLAVVSQHQWIMTAATQARNRVSLGWYNLSSHQKATVTDRGTLEAVGADWALLLKGTDLVLVVPSTGSARLVAQGVVRPVSANGWVYWTNRSRQVRRLTVKTRVIGATPDPAWP
jgi:hypothetical protein